MAKPVAFAMFEEATDMMVDQPAQNQSDLVGADAPGLTVYPLYRDVPSSFQGLVAAWMDQCFVHSLYSDMTERGDRLLEEVLELLQSKGYDRQRVATLVNYVYSRPVGDPGQEVGGVMITLAGFCHIAGLDMAEEGDAELARITQPEVMAKIRAKQEAKNALHFDTPLPGYADRQAQEKAEPVEHEHDWCEREGSDGLIQDCSGCMESRGKEASAENAPPAERVRVPDGWRPMSECPVGEIVIFWNSDHEEIFFGYKPEDDKYEEQVISKFTASIAHLWMKMPNAPEVSTHG